MTTLLYKFGEIIEAAWNREAEPELCAKLDAKKHCIPDGCWYFVDFNELRRKAEKLVMWLDEPQFNTDPGNPHTPDSPHQS